MAAQLDIAMNKAEMEEEATVIDRMLAHNKFITNIRRRCELVMEVH